MSDTDASTIKGKSYSYDPVTDTITFFQESGRRVNQNGKERWAINGGDTLSPPQSWWLSDIKEHITAATIVGKNSEIAGLRVTPKAAVALFLLGVITKEHLLVAREDKHCVNIPQVEIHGRKLTVCVNDAVIDYFSYSLLDSCNNSILFNGPILSSDSRHTIKRGGFSYDMKRGTVGFYGYKASVFDRVDSEVLWWGVNWFEPGAFTRVRPNNELLTHIKGYIENKDRQAQDNDSKVGYHSWKLGMLRVSPRCAVELFLLGVIKLEHMTRAVEDEKTYQDGEKHKYMDIPGVEICGHQFTIQVMATDDRWFCYVFVDVSDGHIFEDSGAYTEYTKPSLPL